MSVLSAICIAFFIASVLSTIHSYFAFVFFIPSSICFTISSGFYVLGLSDVIIVYVAIFHDISPIIGLLPLSLSPPHPNTEITLPLVYDLTACNMFSKLSGE